MRPWNQWKWDEQHEEDERWSLPSSGQTRPTKKWEWPTTTPQKSSTWYPHENRDWQSPTGHSVAAISKEGLPNEFKPSREFLDSREVFGKTLLRRVASTAWSSKYALAGKEVENIKLVDMIWKGYRNHHLRSLSHGHYMCRFDSHSRKEVGSLDDLAKNFLQAHPELCPSKGQSSQEELKAGLKGLQRFQRNGGSIKAVASMASKACQSCQKSPLALP